MPRHIDEPSRHILYNINQTRWEVCALPRCIWFTGLETGEDYLCFFFFFITIKTKSVNLSVNIKLKWYQTEAWFIFCISHNVLCILSAPILSCNVSWCYLFSCIYFGVILFFSFAYNDYGTKSLRLGTQWAFCFLIKDCS